ncbi:unnamed protein product [Medioppia subpectinata]|uniref:RCC1-like domain-containing protein n=1 Tax=Medioppia subpectinata TaxID=1979941 RepID=A0A7R9PXD7_9ACAR|nr:unnamed protein product [Medioppia subpectinata]CAG2104698.1 unnamed protein product [Medioppia subpectinata]
MHYIRCLYCGSDPTQRQHMKIYEVCVKKCDKKMSNSVVVNYKLLRQLRPEFIKRVKTVSVFGRYGTDVVIVTKEDEVYTFGENRNGCLGVGHNRPVAEPTLVRELCHKQVVRFAFGYRHVLVLTKTGQLFSYGYNEFGQLANRTTIDCYVPKVILIAELMRHFIDDISCGAFHSLALTRTGLVYAWGFNFWGQLGNGNNCNQLIPLQVRAINREVVVAIACGHHQSVVLTKSGQVYAWGHNAFGQLGIACTDRFRNIPAKVRVTSEDLMVTKISCGQNHCLLLTSGGHMYSFGCNYFGQIGNDSKQDQFAPTRIGPPGAKFTDIACSLFSNTSAARGANKRAYIWGKCVDERLWVPRETPVKTLEEVFARYNYVTFEPLVLNRKKTFPEKQKYPKTNQFLVETNTSSYEEEYPEYSDYDRHNYRYDNPYGHNGHNGHNEDTGHYRQLVMNFKTPGINKLYADLLNPKLSVKQVNARLPAPVASRHKVSTRSGGVCTTVRCNECLDSCKFLKTSKYSDLDITQYTYLRLCSEGCKDNLPCLQKSECLPVMKENPDFFITCANKCNLFQIIPQIFKTVDCPAH